MQIGLDFDSKKIMRIEKSFAMTLNKHMPEAARLAVVDASRTARAQIKKHVRMFYTSKLKSPRIDQEIKDHFSSSLTKGTSINRLEARYVMSPDSYTLGRFVVGRKKIKQKGVKVANRRKVKVKISKSKGNTVLEKSFMAKARRGNKKGGDSDLNVFFRKGKGKEAKMRMQASISIASLSKKWLAQRIKPLVEKKLTNAYVRHLRRFSKVF